MKTKDLILCAVFAAILCICSVITIPIGVVPITMGLFGVMLTSIILGWKKGAVAVLIFILIGAIGLPVFSGFKGGFPVIAGPTGGYITSYIIMALIIGACTQTLPKNRVSALAVILLSCIMGVFLCYVLGTIQFMYITKSSLIQSLTICVYPFIPFDIAKSLLAAFIGYGVKSGLIKAKLL